MKTKISIIASVLIIITALCFTMTGCNSNLEKADALSDLKTAVEASKGSDSYYTSYADKTTNKTYKLNVWSANNADELNMQFSVETDLSLSVTYTHLFYRGGHLIYKNPAYNKEVSKTNEYFSKPLNKEGLFVNDFTIKDKNENGDVVEVVYNLNKYTDDAFLSLLESLNESNTQIEAYKKNNIVRTISIKVTGEHFLSAYDTVTVRLINDRIYQIAGLSGDTSKFIFDITYVGPKISFPDANKITPEA